MEDFWAWRGRTRLDAFMHSVGAWVVMHFDRASAYHNWRLARQGRHRSRRPEESVDGMYIAYDNQSAVSFIISKLEVLVTRVCEAESQGSVICPRR